MCKIASWSDQMHLGEISFCDRIGYNIKSDEYKKKVLDDLYDVVGFKVVQKHHERFREDLMPMLNKNPHLLTVRTNGNPYLLYLTRYNFSNQCIFIDKKIQHGYYYPRMIIAKLWFDDSLFDGTLLDGEMVKTKDGNWQFIIHDLITERKNDLSNVNVVRRINRVYDLLDSFYKEDDICCCKLRVKKFFTYDELNTMIDTFIPSLNYTCRGIYFKPLYLKFKDILFNFDDTLIQKVVRTKYKDITQSSFLTSDNMNMATKQALPLTKECDAKSVSSESSSVSSVSTHLQHMQGQDIQMTGNQGTMIFWAKKTSQPDIYELYKNNEGGKAEIACVPGLVTSKFMRSLFANCNLTDKKKVICSFSEKFNKWIPTSQAEEN